MTRIAEDTDTDRLEERRDGNIQVHLNGKEREIPADLTLQGLLEHLELNPALVVVEHNREILERDRYDEITVEEDDTLELVHFVGGG